jgi:hypothetical protein
MTLSREEYQYEGVGEREGVKGESKRWTAEGKGDAFPKIPSRRN